MLTLQEVELSLIDHDEQTDVLDRYNVSDSFNQALSPQCHCLPRPHKVRAARKELNELSRMPTHRTATSKSQFLRKNKHTL